LNCRRAKETYVWQDHGVGFNGAVDEMRGQK
jgi:hypothetical protein